MSHTKDHEIDEYFGFIKDCLIKSGFQSIFRTENRVIWQDVYQRLDYQYIGYSNLDIDYYFEIEASNNTRCIDISFLIVDHGKPIAICPLSVSLGNTDNPCHHTATLFYRQNLFFGFLKQKLRVSKICYKLLLSLANRLGQNSISSLCRNQSGINITPWHLAGIQFGAKCDQQYEAYIDLSNSIDEIRRGFRKSYRPLINSSLNLWKTVVVQSSAIRHEFERFQELHFKAAGRRTRSQRVGLYNRRLFCPVRHSWSCSMTKMTRLLEERCSY